MDPFSGFDPKALAAAYQAAKAASKIFSNPAAIKQMANIQQMYLNKKPRSALNEKPVFNIQKTAVEKKDDDLESKSRDELVAIIRAQALTFDAQKSLHTVQAEPARIVFTFNTQKELVAFTIDGIPQSISGDFSAGKTLLLEINSAPERKIKKDVFDRKYSDSYRRRGKSQLKNKIGAHIFDGVFIDEGKNDKFMALSNGIEIKML